MPTQEERLTALEQKISDMELERLYEKRKAVPSTSSEESYDSKQINHRLTMLLGIISGQEEDIGEVKKRLIAVDDRLASVDQRMESHFEALEKRLENAEQSVNSRFDVQDKRFDEIDQHLSSLDEKFDQVLGILTTLTNKP